MIRIYTFTYAGDAQEAVACVRCARTALPEAVVTVVDDSAAPVPPEAKRALVAHGARYRRSSFPRCGNLRGPECVRGIIATLAGGAADGDTVVKIDSDTALLSGGWVREMKHNGLALHAAGYLVPRNPSERSAYGNCYALSGRASRMAAEALECAAIPPLAPEDLTICRAVMDVCGRERVRLDEPWTPLNRAGRWSWWNWDSRTANPEDYARSYDVVSVGNPRPPHVPKNARREVMRALCDARLNLNSQSIEPCQTET